MLNSNYFFRDSAERNIRSTINILIKKFINFLTMTRFQNKNFFKMV